MTRAHENGSHLPTRRIVESLLENAADHVVFLDDELKIVAGSSTFTGLSGSGAGESFLDALDRFTRTATERMFEALRGADSEDGTTTLLHVLNAEDDSVPVLFSWVAVRNEQGGCTGFWGTGREAAAAAQTEEDEEVGQLREQLTALRAEGERRSREIVRLRKQIETHSNRDELTGLGNRRFILERLGEEVPRAIRYDEPLTILLFDVDHLARINEQHGHDIGDDVLRRLSDVVREQVRSTDIVGRYGGEEFMVLCPHTDRASAHFLAERLRRRVAEQSFDARGQDFGVTISTGLVTVTARTEFDVEAILHAAGEALQAAKAGGMNRIQLVEAG